MGPRKHHAALVVGVSVSAVVLGLFGALAAFESASPIRGGPQPRLTPLNAPPAGAGLVAGMDAWSARPSVGSREGSRDAVLWYDNGGPLDDFGDPASQRSFSAAPWGFIAASADDFVIQDFISPDTAVQLTLVRCATAFFNATGHENATPLTYWQGVDVTVYFHNDVLDVPSGAPLQGGGHSGSFVATQYVPVGELLNETYVGVCRPCFLIDIPVNPSLFRLAKNTRYWLSIVPRVNAPPQTAWCISSEVGRGLEAVYGASFGIPFWTTIEGNFGCPSVGGCPSACTEVSNPSAGTNQHLSFQLYGEDLPTNSGACCDRSTGICTDVDDPSLCSAYYQVFHPGTLCSLLSPSCAVATGACCTESTTVCADALNILNCPPGPDQRFVPDALCVSLDPPCSATLGACCLSGQVCVDLTPAACGVQGGAFFSGSCAGFNCPPPNDDCGGAAVIVGDAVVAFDTTGATTDGPAVSGLGCVEINQDVWFKYIASCNGDLTVSLCALTAFDTAISVYEGCVCPATPARQLGCDDDGCGTANGSSVVVVPVVRNQCYLIRLGGAGAATGAGTLTLFCLPPQSGACCHADRTCEITLMADCAAPGDAFAIGWPCSDSTCPPYPDCCSGDANVDGLLDGADVTPFTAMFLNSPSPGTVEFCLVNVDDANGELDMDDIAAYVGKLLAGAPCSEEPVGACCQSDGDCHARTRVQCAIQGGSYQGDETDCDPNLCPQPGACCFPDGSCELLLLGACDAGSGAFQGGGTNCEPNPCPQFGACCLSGGVCEIQEQTACISAGGTFQGLNHPCVPNPCPPPTGACCAPSGVCSTTTSTECSASGGIYQGHDTICDPNPCPQPTGACCAVNGACTVETPASCVLAGGSYEGDDTPCDPNPCPQPTGACCAVSGACTVETAADCVTAGGSYEGDDTPCDPNPCPQPTGACCVASGICSITTSSDCTSSSGFYQGDATSCEPNLCPQPCCRGDVNGDGRISLEDVPVFLAGLLTPPESSAPEFCALDVSADESLDGRDIQRFVELFLLETVCPNNDSCLYATLLGANSEVTADNTEATTDPADPPFSCRSGGGQGAGTLWYKFVAADTTALISTCGSNAPVYDTLLAVYRPEASCPFLISDELACSEDACGTLGRLSKVFLDGLTPGSTYTIQVASYNDASRGPILLKVECPAVGACCLAGGACEINSADECVVAGGSYVGNGSLCEPNPCVIGACCTLIGLCEIRTESSCGAVGGTYLGDGMPCEGALCPPPYYDTCIGAELTGCGMTTVLNNTAATESDSTEPAISCVFPTPAVGERTVWLKFQAARSSARIRTCATSLPVTDTQIAVYGGTGVCPFTPADEMGCNEDSCGRLSSVCVTGLIPGNVYHVAVSTTGSAAPGPITVEVSCPCP